MNIFFTFFPSFYIKKNYFIHLLVLTILLSSNILAQTSGKLTGRVTDENGEALVGANVLITGTKLGAATDIDGYYLILNVRAGTYSVQFTYIGYQSKVVQNIKVSSDQTTTINATLNPQVVEGEVVTITAEKPLVEFNQTSSISSVGKDEIDNLPVQNLTEIVNLQAGVIDGHFRGGRIGEVQYQVDGVTVNNPYDNSSNLQLDRSIIQEVQVISGTFDAKYGQAMSGVVNAVLRTGTEKFQVSGEIYTGNYYTTDVTRYPHNNKIDPSLIQNYQLTISGPVPIPNTTFLLSGRRFLNEGYLFGERRFLPQKNGVFEENGFSPTFSDSKIIPMNNSGEWSGQFKITNQSLEKIQVSYQAIVNNSERKDYDHAYRLNPEGINTKKTFSITHGIDITHTLSSNLFYKLSFRQNYWDYKDFHFEDVFDPGYLAAGRPKGDANYEDGAFVQGVNLGRFIQKTNSGIIKADLTWQADRSNLIEGGLEGQISNISFGSPGFLRETNVGGTEILLPQYARLPKDPKLETYYPKQLAAYLQDRVEWEDLVVRVGVRLEYFDAASTVPSDLQNPANTISGAPLSYQEPTTKKIAVAPRLGFSFPLTSRASVYFSYGHFFQMPGLGDLYKNSNYMVLDELQAGVVDYGVLGNPDLKPQKTIQYEVGLKQALTNFLGLELTFFYKDIRDLLGVEFISNYAAAEYAHLTNIDFGSVYGFTISLDQRAIGPISTSLDYTLQFARGNASDPRETATRASSGKDPRPRDISFDWDQRHTLNATAIYFVPNDYSISAIFKFGSGQPYTPTIGAASFTSDLETNSGFKKSYFLLDLRAEKFFTIGSFNISVFARVFNLLNTNFVNGFVFADTGSPDYAANPTDRAQLYNPGRYYQPRRIELGITFGSF